MSGALGSLVVEVAANVARFQSDMGKIAQIAENRARQIDNAMNIVSNSLKALGAAAVVGLTFEKMRSQVQGAIDSAAGLKDLAERTGGTVEKLSGLAGVARLTGTSTDELAGGIQKLAKAMNEAENGGKTQTAAFQAIGISTKELRGLRPDEVFEKIARKQIEYADGAGKVAVMQALLGKSGANLIPVMNDLAEAGDLQVKVTAEQAEMADHYQKTLTKLEAAQGAAYKRVAMELLPTMTAFAETMLDSAKQSNVLVAGVNALAQDNGLRTWAENTALAIGTTYEALMALVKTARAVGGSFQAVAADIALPFQVAAAAASSGSLSERLTNIGKAVVERNKIVQDANARYEELWSGDKTAFTRGLRERFAMQRAAEMAAANGRFPGMPGADPRKAVGYNPNAGTDSKSPGDRFVEQLQRQVMQLERGRGEMLRLEAAQKGVSKEAAPYILQLEEIERRQANIRRVVEQTARDEEQRAKVTGFVDAGNDMAKSLIQQTEAIGMTAREQRRLTEMRKIDEAVQRAAVGATIETRQKLEHIAEVMRNNVARALDDLDTKERAWSTGAGKAFADYADTAGDAAKTAENLVSGALQRTEDALVNFAKTGKLSFRDLFAFMAEEYIRQQARMAIAGMTSGGLGGLLSGIAGVFNLGMGAGFSYNDLGNPAHLANGLSYVPYDGFPAVLHEGERVMTRAENAGQAGAATTIDMSGAVYNIGQGVSRSEVVTGVRQANAETEARILRRLRQQGVAA